MSSSSSSSESSSDSDDDEPTKQRKIAKLRAKLVRREIRSKEEDEREREQQAQRSREAKQRREYLEMKKKKDDYQRFLLEKEKNPNKEPIVSLLAKTRNRISNALTKRTKTAKKAWYNMSPPRSPIQIGERQNLTPTLSWWRKEFGLPDPKQKSRSKGGIKGGIKSGKKRGIKGGIKSGKKRGIKGGKKRSRTMKNHRFHS